VVGDVVDDVFDAPDPHALNTTAAATRQTNATHARPDCERPARPRRPQPSTFFICIAPLGHT
ncbi:MAG: hypothetical protein ACLPVY_24045, partial [Acidimicrobiia bacterium]